MRGVYLTLGGGQKCTPLVRFRKSGQIFRNLTLGTFRGYIVHSWQTTTDTAVTPGTYFANHHAWNSNIASASTLSQKQDFLNNTHEMEMLLCTTATATAMAKIMDPHNIVVYDALSGNQQKIKVIITGISSVCIAVFKIHHGKSANAGRE